MGLFQSRQGQRTRKEKETRTFTLQPGRAMDEVKPRVKGFVLGFHTMGREKRKGKLRGRTRGLGRKSEELETE